MIRNTLTWLIDIWLDSIDTSKHADPEPTISDPAVPTPRRSWIEPDLGPPASSWRVRDKPAPLLVVHVTDATGGFGVAPYQWKPLTKPGRISRNTRALLTTTDEVTAAKTVALWERYSRTPYHWIAGRSNDAIRNHRPTLRTSHGNRGGNEGMGFAVDCGWDEVLPDQLVDLARFTLRQAIEDCHRASGTAGLVRVVPHRATSKKRRVDPGPFVWEYIVKPAVEASDNARIDYEYRVGRGRPVPLDWDPDALFDAQGRRVRR